MSEGNKEIDTTLIDRLVSDPSKIEDVVQIVGMAGKAPDAARLRIYEKGDLNSFCEMDRADILHADQSAPNGQTEVYVRLDAKITTARVLEAKELKPHRRKLELKLETIKSFETDTDADAMRMTTETSRSPICCGNTSRIPAVRRQNEGYTQPRWACVSNYSDHVCP